MAPLHDERGSVTAETALALPTLIMIGALIASMIWASITTIRLNDAASHSVRAWARGQDPATTASAIMAGTSYTMTISTQADMGCITIAHGALTAHACALHETAESTKP